MRHLIKAFKEFMGFMNNKQSSKSTKILAKPLFYPLNQFHKDFIQKAKQGVSDVNWYHILERIQNDVDDEGYLEFLEQEEN